MIKTSIIITFLIGILCSLNAEMRDTVVLGINDLELIVAEQIPAFIIKDFETRNSSEKSYMPGNLNISYAHGLTGESANNYYVSVQQDLGNILAIKRRKHYNTLAARQSDMIEEITQREYVYLIKKYYFGWLSSWFILKNLEKEREYLKMLKNDMLYFDQLSDTSSFEFSLFEIRYKKFLQSILNAIDDLKIAELKLKNVLDIDVETELIPADKEFVTYEIEKSFKIYKNGNLCLDRIDVQYQIDSMRLWQYREKLIPKISAGALYYNMNPAFEFTGVQTGVTLPVGEWWNKPDKNYILAQQSALNKEKKAQMRGQEEELETAYYELNKYFKEILFYKNILKENIEPLYAKTLEQRTVDISNINECLKSGELYFQYQSDYINTIYNYNVTAVKIEYLVY